MAPKQTSEGDNKKADERRALIEKLKKMKEMLAQKKISKDQHKKQILREARME